MPRVQRGKVAAISTRWSRRVAAPCVCFVPWAALASCRPLPQQLLPVSAAGGGRRRCKQGAARPFQPQRGWLHTKKLAASLNDFFSFLRFEVAARRNVRATACFHADANAPAGSQRQHMPFTVTTFPVKMRLERPCGCAAMKAPVGLSSRRAVCDSRWKGFALTSVEAATNANIKIIFPLFMARVKRRPF